MVRGLTAPQSHRSTLLPRVELNVCAAEARDSSTTLSHGVSNQPSGRRRSRSTKKPTRRAASRVTGLSGETPRPIAHGQDVGALTSARRRVISETNSSNTAAAGESAVTRPSHDESSSRARQAWGSETSVERTTSCISRHGTEASSICSARVEAMSQSSLCTRASLILVCR